MILKMSNKFKEIIKNRTYYFFNDMITTKNLDPNKIKIDEKSYKNILIYYIGYVTVNDLSYAKSSSVKPLYLIVDKINRCIEESNGKKYLTLAPTGESKDTLKIMKNYRTKSEMLLDQKLLTRLL